MARPKKEASRSSPDLLKAVNTLRDRIADLIEEGKAVRDRPTDESVIEAGIRKAVEDEMPVNFESGFDASWLLANPKSFGGLERLFRTSPIAALAVLFGRDAIVNPLLAHALSAAAVEGGCISEDQRAARLLAIESDLRNAEREEERLCREAENSAFVIERRIDANPLWLIADDSEFEVA